MDPASLPEELPTRVIPTDGVVLPFETRVSLVSDRKGVVKSRLAVLAGVRSGEDDRQGERARKPASTTSRCNFSKLDGTETRKALIRRFKGQAHYLVFRRPLVRDDKHVHGNSSTAKSYYDREIRCPTASYSCINKRFTNTKDRQTHQTSNTSSCEF